MTILLTQSVRIAGVSKSAADGPLNLDLALETDLVTRGVATFVGDDPRMPVQTGPNGLTGQQAGGLSIMYLGDSLTWNGGLRHPLQAPRRAYFALSPSLTSLTGNFVRVVRAIASCPTGNGTLSYQRGSRTMTWQAFGDTVGRPVNVAGGGFFMLESGTAGAHVVISLHPDYEPVADASDTVNVTGTPTIVTASLDGFTGAFEALSGMPFGERSMVYAISGIKASNVVGFRRQWQSVYSDITHIHLGTNDIATMADVPQFMSDIAAIIAARMAIGSRVVVGLLVPGSYGTAARRDAQQDASLRLVALSRVMGFETWDAWSYLADPNGADGAPRSTMFQSDGLHTTGLGAVVAAKRAVVPAMARYVPKRVARPHPGVAYNASTAPRGNLLTNGAFTGTSGTISTRASGTLGTSWTVGAAGGSALAIVATAPQAGSPIARTDDMPGAWQRFAINNATGVDGESMQLYQSAFISASNYAAGDVLVLSGDLQVAGSGIQAIQILFGPSAHKCYAVNISAAGYPLGGLDGLTIYIPFESLPMQVEAGGTNLQCAVNVYMLAGGSCTFDLGQTFSLRKLP